MSTRGVNGFFYKGDTKISYNHYDSYPSYLGKKILEFIKDVNEYENGWAKLKERVADLTMVDGDTKPPKEIIAEYKKLGLLNTEVSVGKETDWYCLTRNAQGVDWLTNVFEGKMKHQIDSIDFIRDSLFCEHGYILNLNTMTLEYYEGFQEKPQIEGNRYTMVHGKPYSDREGKYYACHLKKKIKFSDIKTDEDIEIALNKINPKEKEE